MTLNSDINSVTLDFSAQDDQRVLPCSPLLSSDTSIWQGIHVQHHRQPAWETPECLHRQHTIVVHSVASPAKIERRLDGHRRDEQIISGDVVIAPANVRHQVNWNQDIDYTLLILEPTYLAQIAREEVDAEQVEILPHFAKSDPLIYQVGLALKAELEASEQSRLYVETATMMLAVHLLHHYSVRKPSLHRESGLTRNKLQQAIAYIHTHLTEDVSIAAMAATVGMSQYHFARLFKQSTGVTPYQYVLQCRVREAKRLLALPDLSIAQVSQRLGFAHHSQFTAFFRKYVGLTPQAFRSEL